VVHRFDSLQNQCLRWRSRLTSTLYAVDGKSPTSSHCEITLITLRRSSSIGSQHGATENASTENESTGGWNMQVRKTQVRMSRGGKASTENASTNLQRWKTQVQQLKEYCEEFTIFQSCIFTRSAVSRSIDQFTCNVADRCYKQESGHGF